MKETIADVSSASPSSERRGRLDSLSRPAPLDLFSLFSSFKTCPLSVGRNSKLLLMPLTYSRWSQWSLLFDNGMSLASLGPIDEK